ncbi:hypothetical protein FT888_10475 [Clostridium perfringens]|nr:hypothetical protein [Clostridium perfringens]
MAYELCKMNIQGGNYDRKDMLECLNLFRLTNQLTNEQYLELFKLINPPVPVTEEKHETTEVAAQA